MLKRLRVKFIVLTMAMIAVILACVSIAICVIDNQRVVANIYRTLDSSVTFAGNQRVYEEAPEGEEGADVSPDDEGQGVETATGNDDASFDVLRPEIGGMKGEENENSIPIAVYVQYADGTLAEVTTETTAFISDDVLSSAAEQLASETSDKGQIADLDLFYTKRSLGDGATIIAFADASSAESWKSLAMLCAAVDGAALVAFLVISWYFSRWALRPVERAWVKQRQFIVDASHELKTPLTVILANASILLKHPEASIASQSQWIESTQTEAAHLQGLVNDMLALASLDEQVGENKLVGAEPENVDVSDLVETNLLQFESVAFESSIRITESIEPGLCVRGDRLKLERVVSTLIDNAFKYSDAGGSVKVTLAARANQVRLSVCNDGTPIPPEDLPHVFDRFYRADKARTRGVGGYGLGLAIARETAVSLGGDIAVASSKEEGTTFTVTLPKA